MQEIWTPNGVRNCTITSSQQLILPPEESLYSPTSLPWLDYFLFPDDLLPPLNIMWSIFEVLFKCLLVHLTHVLPKNSLSSELL